MYSYRVGETKDILAKVRSKTDTQAVTVASANLRLYGPSGSQIWQKTATIEGGSTLKYRLTDIKVKGVYKVQWVYVIGTETFLSEPIELNVKGANE